VSQFIEVGIYMCGLRNDFTVAFVHLFSSSSKSFSRDFSFPTTLKYIYIYIYIYKETDDRKEKMAIWEDIENGHDGAPEDVSQPLMPVNLLGEEGSAGTQYSCNTRIARMVYLSTLVAVCGSFVVGFVKRNL